MIIPLWVYIVGSVLLVFSSYCMWDHRGSARMVVGFTSTRVISAYKFNHTNILLVRADIALCIQVG